jgi:KDO2-lipid IV(A) lauroyltransferase
MSRAGTPRGYALIADQTPRREDKKHWTRLLDRDTAFFLGAEKSRGSSTRRCSMSTCGACAAAIYSVRFTPLAEPPHAIGTERDDYSPVMEGFARQLENAIRASPADWLWLQKRWKYPKPAAT